ncbi:hypothetical protein F0267_00090 [Vibrio coralliilyticus]|uniref:Uncharacterized protein n=3 Tax=Vibrio TaxID=662 RepID=A0AAN0W1B1_9VIBR|nr:MULTISPECIES: hypothetical protein [Vibrio]CAH1582685.1 conserved hypothetical protein [Vibrio jasicida]AIW22521.1 hypothetical protein IX92_26000 [Vibrio coralliilyticus]MCZ2803308.1 hypothetical protein [Vibrio alginolyticus]NOH36617.1 hypothetical protein [Vibrio coralliilyticus]PAW00289.1 hypothetical protein CKJ79_27760 [Vibrio coralliilyticus]
MIFLFGLMLIASIVLIVCGMGAYVHWKSAEKEHGSFGRLMSIYNQKLKSRRIKETEKNTLENIPTYVFSPYRTAPIVKFVPLFDSAFTWKKHY